MHLVYLKLHSICNTCCMFFRNTVIENVISVLLAAGVGILGALLLSNGFFKDFWIFVFCFVMGSCQYSLVKVIPYHVLLLISMYLKNSFYNMVYVFTNWFISFQSVQPDAASPMHVSNTYVEVYL